MRRTPNFARELCRQAGELSTTDRCHRLIGWFYERKVTDMGGGLTIVSMPTWMDAKDVDLINAALKCYVKCNQSNGPR